MSALPAAVAAWEARGQKLQIAGVEVFVVDHRGDAGADDSDGPREGVVVLHGFPTSSYDWRQALQRFGRGRRVVLLDFPGYGLSEKPDDFSYSLLEQAEVVELVLDSLGVERAHLLAHDMGTSVAAELLARRERGLLSFDARSLLLTNGSVYPELAVLTPSQKILRTPMAPLFTKLSSERVFRWQMRKILGVQVEERELSEMWAQMQYRDGRRLLPRLIGYVDERYRFWNRWIGALRRLALPVQLLWGPLDPVAVPAIAERLLREVPGAELERLDGLGHYPMLEDPERFGAAVSRWLARVAPLEEKKETLGVS